MPSFNVSLPQIPKRFDLRDVTDPVDRKLEVAEQAAALLTATLRDLVINPTTGAALAGTPTEPYPAPEYISTDVATYEAAIAAALAAAVTALDSLKGISSLT